MSSISEIDAMKLIDETLSKIDDSLSRDRILQWAWSKFSTHPTPKSSTEEDKETKKAKKKKRKGMKKSTYSIVKNLNLTASGQQTFAEFVKEKRPSSHREKSVVCVYYLQRILKETPISTNHVYTCFKTIGWRVPSNLENTLAWVASQKGWLDTSNMADIKITTHGENLIEYDLPKKKKDK